jgi:hypothetical protein
MSRLVLTFALLLAGSGALRAQAAPSPASEECFGFSFGAWDPPLKSIAPSASSAPTSIPSSTSRDWAARLPSGRAATGSASDSVLVLFPAWWPNGVGIEWTETGGDTLTGLAHAFVSDGRIKSPVSRVRAIRVPCQSSRP